jgi:hypothetical protein
MGLQQAAAGLQKPPRRTPGSENTLSASTAFGNTSETVGPK